MRNVRAYRAACTCLYGCVASSRSIGGPATRTSLARQSVVASWVSPLGCAASNMIASTLLLQSAHRSNRGKKILAGYADYDGTHVAEFACKHWSVWTFPRPRPHRLQRARDGQGSGGCCHRCRNGWGLVHPAPSSLRRRAFCSTLFVCQAHSRDRGGAATEEAPVWGGRRGFRTGDPLGGRGM
jgi:hypothetical protein